MKDNIIIPAKIIDHGECPKCGHNLIVLTQTNEVFNLNNNGTVARIDTVIDSIARCDMCNYTCNMVNREGRFVKEQPYRESIELILSKKRIEEDRDNNDIEFIKTLNRLYIKTNRNPFNKEEV